MDRWRGHDVCPIGSDLELSGNVEGREACLGTAKVVLMAALRLDRGRGGYVPAVLAHRLPVVVVVEADDPTDRPGYEADVVPEVELSELFLRGRTTEERVSLR